MTDFIARRKPAWDRLNEIIVRAKRGGVRRLGRDELKQMGALYRRVAADLAYARMRGADPGLILYLNDLTLRAHGMVYADRSPGWGRLWQFLRVGFPRLLRRRKAYVLLAAAVFLVGGALGALLTLGDPDNAVLFLGERAKETNFYKDLPTTMTDEKRAGFAADLMTNNTGVAVKAFAAGVLGGFPTLWLLFVNGLPIGALAVLQHDAGLSVTLWSFLLPHGVPELTAIFIAGGAGMMLGHALLAPGELTRRDALVVAGGEAVRLLLGTVTLFVLAGFIESFISPTALPPAFKFTFAALMALALAAYFRSGAEETEGDVVAHEGAGTNESF